MPTSSARYAQRCAARRLCSATAPCSCSSARCGESMRVPKSSNWRAASRSIVRIVGVLEFVPADELALEPAEELRTQRTGLELRTMSGAQRFDAQRERVRIALVHSPEFPVLLS